MKLLLVYPQHNSDTKHRLSRTDAQLNGISQATKTLLERGTRASVQVDSLAYSQNQDIKSALKDTDLVIDICATPETSIQPLDFAGPVIHLSPTFNGSFACNDITVTGYGRLMQSDVAQSIAQSRKPYIDFMPSTHELDATMHYAAFSPLPTRVGDAFYRTLKDHAVVFLSYPEHARDEQTIDADKQALSNILHTAENIKSITFVCESLDDVPIIKQVAKSLKGALGLQASIWGLRKGEFHDIFSIMAKSSVSMFGGNSLFADAIIRGLPVYLWRSDLPGSENIAQAYQHFCTGHKTDQSVLLKAQRKHLNRLIDAQYLDATLPNHRRCFDSALTDLVNKAIQGHSFRVTPPNESAPSWVIEPASAPVSRSRPEHLSRSVWRDRQNLIRFKQPASRTATT